jgi:hypothetical protein
MYISRILIIINVFSPTYAQLESLKNNFKFALKLTLKSKFKFVFKANQLSISWWKKI